MLLTKRFFLLTIFASLIFCAACSKPPHQLKLTFPGYASSESATHGEKTNAILLFNDFKCDEKKGNYLAGYDPNSFVRQTLQIGDDPSQVVNEFFKNEMVRRGIFRKVITVGKFDKYEEGNFIIQGKIKKIGAGESSATDMIVGIGGQVPVLNVLLIPASYIAAASTEITNQEAVIEIECRLVRTHDYVDLINKTYTKRLVRKVKLDKSGGEGQAELINQAFHDILNDIMNDVAQSVVKSDRLLKNE